ncbi:MAG TPA: hypothetical protein VKU60_11735, partial [Chloroflexota bacterium]|nr:hypothetical protein [Chloroflexota bacterium]
MSFVASVSQRAGALHWRLTLFYAAAMTALLLGFGFYLDHQLSRFAVTQLQDRLIARTPGGAVAGRPRRDELPSPLTPPAEVSPSLPQVATFAART